ncbi:hypothetical protein ACRWP7_003329 [Escherichia coli]
MLLQDEVVVLGQCLEVDNHILVQIDTNNFVPDSLALAKVTDNDDVRWFVAYSILRGRDLQSLFRAGDYEYLTLFIDDENVNGDFKDKLKKYGLLNTFLTESPTTISISYPEKRYTSVTS